MLTVLARIFIKNYKNYEDNSVREKYGVLCGAVGIFLNFLQKSLTLNILLDTAASSIFLVL